MDTNIRFLKLLEYLATNHSDINIDNLQYGKKEEAAVLSVIKEFANYDYDHAHKFFTRDIKGVMFATENIVLKEINTIPDLHHAIGYLNHAYEKRLQVMEQAITLPERLYAEPEKVQDISRGNIMVFLQETYGLHSEKEFLELKDQKQKEVVYDLYRNFTGFTPIKKSHGSIMFTFPEEPDLKLQYSDYPDFTNESLFSHIRDMRGVNKNTQQMVRETTTERIEQIKGLGKDKLKEKDGKQLKKNQSKANIDQDLEH